MATRQADCCALTATAIARTFFSVLGAAACLAIAAEIAFAQQLSTASPAEALKEGWEEIDARLVFLTVRLANVETSLDAIDKIVASKTRQQAASRGKARQAEKNNEEMDRKGGGPVHWKKFYGRTADQFFRNPGGRNTSYYTTAVLKQLPASQDGTSISLTEARKATTDQRPPQFDYIYKANEQTKERAEQEAKSLAGNVDALLNRRRQLEGEQVTLWCQVAFRVVSRYDLPKKPLYRFVPVAASSDAVSQQRAEGVKAAASFVRTALSVATKAEDDRDKAFGDIKLVVSSVKEQLDDVFLQQEILDVTTSDLKTSHGRFAALAKHLEDVAANLSDSYKVSIEGEQAHDQLRKDTFRALLQESLWGYAQTVLALDEMASSMAREWKTKPDLHKPQPLVIANVTAPRRVEQSQPEPTIAPATHAASSPLLYLADLKEMSVEVLEYGGKAQFAKGEIEDGGRKKKISVAGKESPKGIFAHPKTNGKSRVTYDLKGRKYKYFEASVGVDDSKSTPGDPGKSYQFSPLTFQVWGDGKMLWQSQPFAPGGQPQACTVALPEISQLELIVRCPGDCGSAWAVWSEPRLVNEGIAPTPEAAKASGGGEAAVQPSPNHKQSSSAVSPASEDARSQWVNATYPVTLRHIKDMEWAEFDNKTGKSHLRYKETARTKDYIELFCTDRNQELRVLAKRMELKKDGKWGWVATGHWASVAK